MSSFRVEAEQEWFNDVFIHRKFLKSCKDKKNTAINAAFYRYVTVLMSVPERCHHQRMQ